MTLEEMGRDYLRQSEEIWEKIQKYEEQLANPDLFKCLDDFEKLKKKIMSLYEVHDDLMRNGIHLINYYQK